MSNFVFQGRTYALSQIAVPAASFPTTYTPPTAGTVLLAWWVIENPATVYTWYFIVAVPQ